MNALVTGATGFLGRHLLADAHRHGIAVRALVRTATSLPPGVESVIGDLTDPASLRRAVEGVEVVMHAAARVTTSGTWAEFYAANVEGTAALIQASVGARVRRVVHISSLSVYGVPADGVTITEESAYENGAGDRGFYARSKLIADRLALQAARGGAPVTVIRPGLLYGPGRRPPLARRAIATGPFRVILGNPRYLLPLSFVENVAEAAWRAAAADEAVGKAYTIVDFNVPQGEYTQQYRGAAGEHWWPLYVPAALLMPVARSAELAFGLLRRASPVTRHQLRRTTWSAYYDCTRAERELGWQPRVVLAEGLRRSFAASP